MNRIMTGYNLNTTVVSRQKTVSKLDFLKTKLMMRLLLIIAFTVILSLFYIWSRVKIVQVGYELNEYSIEQETLTDENKRLQIELSLMNSPERIRNYVTEKLNMSFADKNRIVEIK